MKKRGGMKIGMLLIIVISMGLPVFAMHVTTITTIQSGGSESAAVMAGNQTNTTIFGDSAYIEGYYPALDLYVTLPTDISGPMITPFLINVTAAGQAVAELYTGNALYSRSQFTGHIVIQNNVSYTGNVNLTLDIISSQGVVQYRWLPEIMHPASSFLDILCSYELSIWFYIGLIIFFSTGTERRPLPWYLWLFFIRHVFSAPLLSIVFSRNLLLQDRIF